MKRGLDAGATAYILMFAVYSYVDMSWDARNTVFLGLALAICGGEESRRNASYEAGASIDTVSS